MSFKTSQTSRSLPSGMFFGNKNSQTAHSSEWDTKNVSDSGIANVRYIRDVCGIVSTLLSDLVYPFNQKLCYEYGSVFGR